MSKTPVGWVDGMPFVAESAGHAIVVDGAPGFGRDSGMPPMRLLLGAAGYSAMDVVRILKNRMLRVVTGFARGGQFAAGGGASSGQYAHRVE